MDLKLLNRRFKISLFSIAIFIFFLVVAMGSLHVMREKILENSHIMGEEIAARFATRETSRIKSQEILLRSVAQNMGSMLRLKNDWTDAEIEQALIHFTDYMQNNTEVARFDMCAVINGRLICSRPERGVHGLNNVKWYQAALSRKGDVAYTNLYQTGPKAEYVLTMAVRIGTTNDVLAMNLYPEQLNALLADNRLPPQSYYYLCDPNGNIMFAINDRNLSLEKQQPYVDQIFSELRRGNSDGYIIDLEGKKRGVYYTVSDRGWISVVTIPYDFLLGDYQNLLQWFIVILGVFAMMVVLLGMREHVLNKQVQSINEVVQVMSKSFLAVFRVNLRTGQYEMLKGELSDSKNMGFVPKEQGVYTELLAQLVPLVEHDAAQEFAETFSLDNIKELIKRKIYDFGGEFRQRFGNEYKWVYVHLLWDEQLGPDDAIFFFREVDAEKLKELEHMKVTERALKVARENTKSRNMFFSAMSHDMRAPLNGIIGMAELAELHKDDQVLVEDYVQKIKSSGKQLLMLINDILEMARLDNGKVEHLQENFDMAAVSKEIADMFGAQSELEHKFFTQEIMLEPIEVNGDLQGLHQILNNVLSNAVKYTQAGGKISFTVRREKNINEQRALFSFVVQDTGCGMSEKFLEKIYTPFERDSRFGVPKVVGTGLGMAIVKSLVDRLDGTITISSQVDVGTCVIISLPFQLAPEQLKAKHKDAPKLKDFAGRTVLVADDNDISMEIITELLTMNGLKVLTAANGREAVEAFKSSAVGSVDMVLMDVQMPELDGCEATRELRALARADAETVPVLALTGNSGSEDVEAAMQAGMNNYMVKPVQMKLLARMMSEYIH
ncbi:MAG: response regulator [Phascolarctobacterium sp.]|nr:response regulator [Phascolarctobacterium sp.]